TQSVGVAHRGFASAQAFFESQPPDGPGCVLTDLRMPGWSGVELLRRCREVGVGMPVVIFTGHADVPATVSAMKAGAFDFLEKPGSEQLVLEAIQAALLADARRQEEKRRHEGTATRLMTLTPGQRDVLEGMMLGTPYKAIAARLGVSYKTVEARRAKVLEKMGCETLAELLVQVIGYRAWTDAGRPRAG
ncbi:MAG: response regulator transcription factor, partial [Gemmataceae bacterium]